MEPILLDNLKAVAAMKRAPENQSGASNPRARADIVAEIEKHLRSCGRTYDVKEKGEFTYYEITDGGCLTGEHGGTGFGFQVFPSGAAVYHCHHDTCSGDTGMSAWDLIGVEKSDRLPAAAKKSARFMLADAKEALRKMREEQSMFWLKEASGSVPEGTTMSFVERCRDLVRQCAGLNDAEILQVMDEIERTPPLVERKRTELLRLWRKSRQELKKAMSGKATDDEIADAYVKEYGQHRMFTRDRWYAYTGGVWVQDVDVTDELWETMIKFKDEFGVSPTSNKRRSVEECACGLSRLGVMESKVDAHPSYINFENGVYDIDEDGLIPHSPDFYLTTQLPFEYDKDATCDRWKKFLGEVLVNKRGKPSQDMIQFIQQAFGYSLTADTKYEVSFWLQGAGSNGKSTLLNILMGLLGTAAMSLNLGMLERDTYQLAQLPGIRLVTCAESPVGMKVADSIIKSLVSGERMSVRLPYGKPFQLEPICKVWWAMNNPPRVADASDGFWRRVKVIPFRNRFTVKDGNRDPNLGQRLISELPGIFNWAIDGLVELETQGWVVCDEIESATDAYRESNDIEAAFVSECCIVGEEYKVSAGQLYSEYETWCRNTGHRAKSMTRVAQDWERLGFIKLPRSRQGIFYEGVGLLEKQPLADMAKREPVEDIPF